MGILARTLLFTALTGLVGLASAQILLRTGIDRAAPAGPEADPGPQPGSIGADGATGGGTARRYMGLAFSLLGLVAALLLGWAQLSAFRDPFVPWREDAAVLLGTPWGRRWLLLLTGFVVSAAAFSVPRTRFLGWALAPVLALYPSTSGHAASAEGLAPLTMTLDWVHILASGAWIGALGVLAWAARPGASSPLVRALPAFSLQARVAVALIVLTGSAAALVHVGSFSALTGSLYGRILLSKIGLVGLLLLTGFYNWRVLSGKVDTDPGAARLVRSARAEVALGLGVLVLTAWVTGTAPPG